MRELPLLPVPPPPPPAAASSAKQELSARDVATFTAARRAKLVQRLLQVRALAPRGGRVWVCACVCACGVLRVCVCL